jgi:hypothetical protein
MKVTLVSAASCPAPALYVSLETDHERLLIRVLQHLLDQPDWRLAR